MKFELYIRGDETRTTTLEVEGDHYIENIVEEVLRKGGYDFLRNCPDRGEEHVVSKKGKRNYCIVCKSSAKNGNDTDERESE